MTRAEPRVRETRTSDRCLTRFTVIVGHLLRPPRSTRFEPSIHIRNGFTEAQQATFVMSDRQEVRQQLVGGKFAFCGVRVRMIRFDDGQLVQNMRYAGDKTEQNKLYASLSVMGIA